jgi:hypothetical protein
MTSLGTTSDRELARRAGDGIEVSLVWNNQTNSVRVRVFDGRSGDRFELPVDGRDALDAYNHPFAYTTRTHRPMRADEIAA